MHTHQPRIVPRAPLRLTQTILGLTTFVVACRDAPLPPAPIAQVGAQFSVAPNTQIRSIGLTLSISSEFSGRPAPRVKRMNILRTTENGDGHRTSYSFDNAGEFANTGTNTRRPIRVELDEKGKATMFRADGSQRALPIAANATAALLAESGDASDAVRTAAARRASESARLAPIGAVTGDWIDSLVTTPAQRLSAIAVLSRASALPVRTSDGLDHYRSTTGDQTADAVVDPTTSRVLSIVLRQQGREYGRVQYSYLDLGSGLFVRTGSELVRSGGPAGSATRTKLEFSQLTINGVRVQP